ncbi:MULTISPECIES: LysR family transcriptional regulator [Lichenihabitans]|uniref:LysR family transcriptional regulator n=1 Tax=Lichenihabitans TaxID=2723776 RepID=UPI0010359E84|nr:MULTISPECIES: LysR family transcriptional regulator [Lichenihabitans]UDL93030.1 LysR family transcriptional regulator [Lichenihabitans sp. PAMC28606]
MDWDRLRVFQAAAEAGSFTHAGQSLNLSQSAVSRQISALEQDLEVPLFHRHARGLILTEQGELLLRTVQDVMLKLDVVKTRLTDSREKPNGELRITTNYALGTFWLTPRLGDFLELYPDIRVQLIITDEELDLGMREADVGLRLREPLQPDLIRRRLFTVRYHAYASTSYLKRHGQPKSTDDLDKHRLIEYSGGTANYLTPMLNSLQIVGRDAKGSRSSALTVNNMVALRTAVQSGAGIGVLPDYAVEPESGVVQLLQHAEMPELDCFFVYPEELKSVARVQVFRDFLVSNAQRWRF